jgi:hypothetical protein
MTTTRRPLPELVPMRRTVYLSDETGALVISATVISVVIVALNETGQELWTLILPITGATDSRGWKRAVLIDLLERL